MRNGWFNQSSVFLEEKEKMKVFILLLVSIDARCRKPDWDKEKISANFLGFVLTEL